jgi:hypothetical protein
MPVQIGFSKHVSPGWLVSDLCGARVSIENRHDVAAIGVIATVVGSCIAHLKHDASCGSGVALGAGLPSVG